MRERIVESAYRQITCTGFRKFTVEAIASELGISKKTIYKHFDTKEQIVTAVVDRIVHCDQCDLEAIAHLEGSVLQKIDRVIRCDAHILEPWMWVELKQTFPQEWAKAEAMAESGKNLVLQLVKEGMASGEFRDTIDPLILGMLINSVKEMLMDMRFLVKNNLTMDSAIEAVSRIILFGILSDERRSGMESGGVR